MKVLVSAIACDPFGGSEGAAGWRNVRAIAENHDVFVMTSPRHRESWERAQQASMIPDSIRVRFIGSFENWRSNRFLARIQSWTEYDRFCKIQLDEARRWIREEGIDMAHQVSYATWRLPTSLWQLPVPFIWGPLGGSGRMSSTFYPILSTQAIAFEVAREVSSALVVRRKSFRQSMENCGLILSANGETTSFLTPYRRRKPIQNVRMGHLSDVQIERLSAPLDEDVRTDSPLRIFAGGNLEGRKGVALALRALAIAKTRGVKVHYLLGGGGPEVPKLRAEASRLGLSSGEVEFHAGFSGEDYIRVLRESEVYLLPSFRETTGMTLVEAMVAGCYPIVADASAQGEIIREFGGDAIPTISIESLVCGLADAIERCWHGRASLRARGRFIGDRIAPAFSPARFREGIATAYQAVFQG